MFEKLISLLPYNPGISNQLAFYGRRMRQEASIRRTGLIFIVLTFVIQFFAVIVPPQVTSADSNNDLINGGFDSAANAEQDCNSNLESYKTILANYGITCSEVGNSPTVTIHSTDHNRDLFSMGRIPYGLAGETPVTIASSTYYVRYLWSWDKGGPASTYTALRILSENGTLYYLLYGCGNLTSVGIPVPYQPAAPTPVITPAPSPKLKLIKTTTAGYPEINSIVAPGTTLGYSIYVNNSGGNANNVNLSDTLPSGSTYKSMSLNAGASQHVYDSSSNSAKWSWDTIGTETDNYVAELKVTVNAGAYNGERICNIANLTSSNGGSLASNQVCMTVKVPTVSSPVPTPTPTPTQPTPTTVTAAPVTPTPCAIDTSIPASSSECKPCEASLSSEDAVACVVVHKTASNITQGIADANNTTAHGGDTILYTLYADNTGKATVSNYLFQEDLSDVMDYADPVDLYGGNINSSDVVTWPTINIAPGQTATEQVSVKVKNPIPSTPVDPNDPGHFNMIMTNVYGNTVNINLPSTPITTVETASKKLPNTGPGTSIFLSAAVVFVIAYFYFRARLLAQESSIAIKQNAGGPT